MIINAIINFNSHLFDSRKTDAFLFYHLFFFSMVFPSLSTNNFICIIFLLFLFLCVCMYVCFFVCLDICVYRYFCPCLCMYVETSIHLKCWSLETVSLVVETNSVWLRDHQVGSNGWLLSPQDQLGPNTGITSYSTKPEFLYIHLETQTHVFTSMQRHFLTELTSQALIHFPDIFFWISWSTAGLQNINSLILLV